jgi:formylmethanofuran dehydrogenase subunit E
MPPLKHLRRISVVTLVSGFVVGGCAPAPPPPAVVAAAAPSPDDALSAVAFVHGGAGPWAVLGYRMGRAAMARLKLPRQSFDLVVVHHTPPEVQFSCIADGAAAATGASVGKLNLKVVGGAPGDVAGVATTYENRATGESVTLRPAPAFVRRFRDVPRDKLADAGREVMGLPDLELFVVDATPVRTP